MEMTRQTFVKVSIGEICTFVDESAFWQIGRLLTINCNFLYCGMELYDFASRGAILPSSPVLFNDPHHVDGSSVNHPLIVKWLSLRLHQSAGMKNIQSPSHIHVQSCSQISLPKHDISYSFCRLKFLIQTCPTVFVLWYLSLFIGAEALLKAVQTWFQIIYIQSQRFVLCVAQGASDLSAAAPNPIRFVINAREPSKLVSSL